MNGRSQKRSTSSRAHADLVKWQGTPIRSPLLRLPIELSPLAIECFECILRYCGDLPPDPEQTEVKCVYTVLMVSMVHCGPIDDAFALPTTGANVELFVFDCSIVTSISRYAMKSTVN